MSLKIRLSAFVLLASYLTVSLFAVFGSLNCSHSFLFLFGVAGMFVLMVCISEFWPESLSINTVVVTAIIVRLVFLFIYNSDNGSELLFKWPVTREISPILYEVSRISLILLDIFTIFLLDSFLRSRKIPAKGVFFYALNPIVIIFSSGTPCFESISVFFAIFSLVAMVQRKWLRSFVSVFIGVIVNPFCIYFFLFFSRKSKFGFWCFAALVCTLLIAIVNSKLFTFPSWTVNANRVSLMNPIYWVLNSFLNLKPQIAINILQAILTILLTAIYFLTPSLILASYQAIAAVILLQPVIYPYSLLVIIPFTVLFHQKSWLMLSFTTLIYYLTYEPNNGNGLLHNQGLIMLVVWTPFILIAVLEFIFRSKRWPVRYDNPKSFSIVIPTLNEQSRIQRCIASVSSEGIPTEIIVVDGGSVDATLQLVSKIEGVTVLQSRPGRGNQIAQGVASAKGDVIIVLHSDSVLQPGAIRKVRDELSKNPDASGGAFELMYTSKNIFIQGARLLHNAKAALTGISFGDQAQFFRRDALQGGFPAIPLMEDVELSMLLQEQGKTVFLSKGVISSSRQWDTSSYICYFFKVLFFVSYYLFFRSISLDLAYSKTESLYKKYYGK